MAPVTQKIVRNDQRRSISQLRSAANTLRSSSVFYERHRREQEQEEFAVFEQIVSQQFANTFDAVHLPGDRDQHPQHTCGEHDGFRLAKVREFLGDDKAVSKNEQRQRNDADRDWSSDSAPGFPRRQRMEQSRAIAARMIWPQSNSLFERDEVSIAVTWCLMNA